jgi:hypothetical protein
VASRLESPKVLVVDGMRESMKKPPGAYTPPPSRCAYSAAA